MQRRFLLGWACASTLGGIPDAQAQTQTAPTARPTPPELRVEWGEASPARPQGETRMRFFGLAVYDIALWAPSPVPADSWERQALALAITYRRNLSGERIAERSLDEMRRGGPIDDATAQGWLAEMKRLFPDVNDGDRITGVLQPGQAARFHLNGRLVGELRDARFAALFFGIWLAPWTSEPALRSALLGSPR